MARKLRRRPIDNTVVMDMTPMIDIVFLLLIFFMLTTKFTPDEKAISSLMPTNMGQAQASSPSPVPPDQINIKIYPRTPGPVSTTNQFIRNLQPSAYRDLLTPILAERQGRAIDDISVQVGGGPATPIEGKYLSMPGGPLLDTQLRNFKNTILEGLESRDNQAAVRKDAPPIIIHCFSKLSWKYALLAYDSVRAFEADKGAGIITKNSDLINARQVAFAPPRVRNYSANEDGNELYEIIHMK